MKKVLYSILAWALLLHVSAFSFEARSQGNISLFSQRDFGKYLLADMYSPNTQSSFGAGSLMSEYNINPNRRSTFALYNETIIGTEIPIMTWNISGADSGSKLALSVPVSASILLDLSEPWTHPIVNTDYRLGALEINYLHELNLGFLKNISIRLIPYYHESSHIGDEIVIYRKDAGFPITRVNATGNTTELAISINDENSKQENNHAFTLGSRILHHKKNGFYWARAVEADNSKITSSDTRFEMYGQYQWHGSSGFINNPKFTSVFSVEMRNRVLYNYPYYIYNPGYSKTMIEVNSDRKFVPSINGLLGWRYRISEEKASYIGLHLRFYVGANPYGQFRNIPAYRFYGLCFVYEN